MDTAPAARESDLQIAFEAQRTRSRRQVLSYRERIGALSALERSLIQHQDGIIDAISKDFGGRSAEETLALELVPTLSEIREALRHLKLWMQPRRVAVSWNFLPAKARVRYQALGVVGILSAWNYPLFLSFGPMAGAIAAGNRVMLKPSELAPRIAELMQVIVTKTLLGDYVAVVTGDAETGAAFSRLPFDHLLYTGSARVGKLVMKAAAENLTPVTLELGGKSPALIHSDYPMRLAVERILTGKLYNAGQTCVAPDYVLVPRDRRDSFVSLARETAARLYPTLAANREYTRIINAGHYHRIAALVDDARRAGAEAIVINPASETCGAANRVFLPTLIVNPHEDSAIMQEEIFGPVLPVVEYASLDDAIEFINARPRPLALYYFDENRARVEEILERTTAGGVTVNDCVFHVGQCGLPFGGVGASGMGQYHGFDGFETFSKKKGVLYQRRVSLVSLLRPPYTNMARRILRFLAGT